jgi:hypothetical protein
MRTGKPLASKCLMTEVRLRPSSKVVQVSATLLPAGVTSPSPVMATRRFLVIAL